MEQYFDSKKLDRASFEDHSFFINNKKYVLYTAPGVFSRSGLDFGTRLLLETIPLERIKGKVLDIGCGAGPIGIFVSLNTEANVVMSDVNEAAIELAKINLIKNKVTAGAMLSDGYKDLEGKFDFIITNPPIRVGYKKLLDLIRGAREYLSSNGELYYVIRKKQGGERLVRDTDDIFDNEIIAKKKGYLIVKGVVND